MSHCFEGGSYWCSNDRGYEESELGPILYYIMQHFTIKTGPILGDQRIYFGLAVSRAITGAEVPPTGDFTEALYTWYHALSYPIIGVM